MAKSDPNFEVEYMPVAPADVKTNSTWFISKCASRDEAIGLEKAFHTAGWVARIVVVNTERSFFG